MIIASATDVGKKRKENQDSFRVALLGDGGFLAVVCDGMGGANGGRLASVTAADVFVQSVQRKFHVCNDPFDLLIYSVYKANEAVFELSGTDESLEGMGTTLAAVLLKDGKAYAVNVGDSRIYSDNGSEMTQITRDHTLVQLLVDMGEMNIDEARTSPDRHKITRAVGVNADVRPDVFEISGSGFILICSDGLYGELEKDEIHRMLKGDSYREIKKNLSSLVSLANRRGGSDNITAIVIKQ